MMLTRAAVLAGRVPGGPLRQLGRGLRRMTVSASQSGVPEPPTVDWSREGANSVSLIGTVGKDPMPRVLPSGKKVCSIRIAVNQPGKTERPADWYQVEAWDEENGPKLATQMEYYCRKGSRVQVSGRLKLNTYETKDGRTVTEPLVALRELSFVARGEGGSMSSSGYTAASSYSGGGAGSGDYDSYYDAGPPAAAPAPAQRPAYQNAQKSYASAPRAAAAAAAASRPPAMPPLPPQKEENDLKKLKEELWWSVYNEYSSWEDLRSLQKRAPTDPDFVHKTNKAWTLNLEMDQPFMPSDVYLYFYGVNSDEADHSGGADGGYDNGAAPPAGAARGAKGAAPW